MRRLILGALVTLALTGARPSGAPAGAVRWWPAHPLSGSLLWLRLDADSLGAVGPGAAPSGEAAGEPLHFEPANDGTTYRAMAAAPLEAQDTLVALVALRRPDGTSDTITVAVPVGARPADTDRLVPSGQFARPPDSTLTARIDAERAAVHAVERRSHERPRLWRRRFVRPVRGRVTDGFAVWREWNGTLQGRHDGVDLAGTFGTPVRAANRGIVALVGARYRGGLTVLIDHGAGLVTSYQHLSSAAVQVGDTVARGQVLGLVGASGRVTGPHLHWGASYGAIAVDPLGLLVLDPPTEPSERGVAPVGPARAPGHRGGRGHARPAMARVRSAAGSSSQPARRVGRRQPTAAAAMAGPDRSTAATIGCHSGAGVIAASRAGHAPAVIRRSTSGSCRTMALNCGHSVADHTSVVACPAIRTRVATLVAVSTSGARNTSR